ncbi:MAG: hypothetical protein QGH41_03405 [Roseibacillus sp.]|nr:hypothetical protein [Roseibacillus sp.]MDP7497392.1 hypothetical protein [Roseibacillus sp.]
MALTYTIRGDKKSHDPGLPRTCNIWGKGEPLCFFQVTRKTAR